jgi:hypothetical protein
MTADYGTPVCEVCGRATSDVAWITTPYKPSPRWLCTDETACFESYRGLPCLRSRNDGSGA